MCINFCFDRCIKFPVVVLTNHCKLSGLRQHKLISQFWGSEIQNQLHWAKAEVWTGMAAFVEGRIHLFPCLFQFLEAIFIPWLMVPSSHRSKLLTLKITKNHFKNQYLLYIPIASQIFLQNKMANHQKFWTSITTEVTHSLFISMTSTYTQSQKFLRMYVKEVHNHTKTGS